MGNDWGAASVENVIRSTMRGLHSRLNVIRSTLRRPKRQRIPVSAMMWLEDTHLSLRKCEVGDHSGRAS